MTKEEFYEHVKNNYKYGDVDIDVCRDVACPDCPFDSKNCLSEVIYDLLNKNHDQETRLHTLAKKLKDAEQHLNARLNFEYLSYDYVETDEGILILLTENGKWLLRNALDVGRSVQDWMYAEYREPKYKLTRFEYDVLRSCVPDEDDVFNDYRLCDYEILKRLKKIGYFENIELDQNIGDVLNDCMVYDIIIDE